MTGRQALVEVSREEHASVARAAHQPFPFGLDTRPLDVEESEALLTSSCDWTNSVSSFLYRHIAQRDGGASFTMLKESAQQDFLAGNLDGWSFSVFRLADFLEAAYRSGLLAKNSIAPNGDIYSPDRTLMYEIAPEAQALLARHTPNDVEKRADAIPSLPEVKPLCVPEQLEPVVTYLRERGPTAREDIVETLTQSASDDTVVAECDRLDDAIDEGIRLGILSQAQDRLGARVISIATNDTHTHAS